MSLNLEELALIKNQIQKLFELKFLTAEQKEKILLHYQSIEPSSSFSRALTALGILAALLIGGGIILIFAYNWQNFSRYMRVFLSMLPMLIAQSLSLFVILKKYSSLSWREPLAVFWYLSLGAGISLISQTYHLGGSLDSFFWIWFLGGLPIVYLIFSVAGFIFALFLLLAYTTASWDALGSPSISFFAWGFLLSLLPFYFAKQFAEMKKEIQARKYFLSGEILSVALVIVLLILIPLTIASDWEWFADGGWKALYVSMFTLLALAPADVSSLERSKKTFALQFFLRGNALFVIGFGGLFILLFLSTFHSFWKDVSAFQFLSFWFSNFIYFFFLITSLVGIFLLRTRAKEKRFLFFPLGGAALLMLALISVFSFSRYISPDIFMLIMNLYLFSAGVVWIVQGIQSFSLLRMNIGFLTAALIIIYRFYDMNISMLIRGVIFISLGLLLFFLNYRLGRKSKNTN